MAERVIELKVLVLDELGDAINFVLAVVEDNVWIRDGDDVDHATAQLMGKDRPLLYANIDLELISGDVLQTKKKQGRLVDLSDHAF